MRRLPSRIANWLIGRVTGVRLHDYGCTLKAYRAEVVRETRLYGEMHRFLPALAYQAGARITEVPVSHHPRASGTSKYGLGRTFKVLLDLLTVKFLSVWSTKPSYVFGGSGAILCLLGTAVRHVDRLREDRQRHLRLPPAVAARRRLPLHHRLQPDPARAARGADRPDVPRVAGEAGVPRPRAAQLRGGTRRLVAAARAATHVRHLWDRRVRPGRPRGARADDPRTRAPWARRRGLPRRGVRRRDRRRARVPPAVDHRPRDREPADRQRGRLGPGRLQRRDLQLPRAARGARGTRPPLRDERGHRGDRPPLRGPRPALRRAAERHVRVRALGRARAASSLLARDRFGKKPLYYADVGGTLLFGSELKALLEHPRCPRELDADSLSRYLALEYVPAPHAIFEGVRKLPGGHVPRAGGTDGARSSATGTSRSGPLERDRPDEEYVEEFRERLPRSGPPAARERRPARRVPERRDRLELGRRDDGRRAPCRRREDVLDRLRRAELRRVARTRDASRRTSAPTTTRRCSRRKPWLDVLPTVVDFLDEPFGDASILPTYLLSRFTREHVTVALGGDGSDELLAGYPTFAADRFASLYRGAPLAARARRRSRSPTGCPSRRRTSASTSSSSGFCAAPAPQRASATRHGSARSRLPSRTALLARTTGRSVSRSSGSVFATAPTTNRSSG